MCGDREPGGDVQFGDRKLLVAGRCSEILHVVILRDESVLLSSDVRQATGYTGLGSP